MMRLHKVLGLLLTGLLALGLVACGGQESPSSDDKLSQSCEMPNVSPALTIKYPKTLGLVEDGADRFVLF